MTQPGPTTADVGPLKKYGMLLWTVAGIVFMAYYAALSERRLVASAPGDEQLGDIRRDIHGAVGESSLANWPVPAG